MKYNFVEADTGMFIGNLVELELFETPRVGEQIAFAADGQSDEVIYFVDRVKRIIHKDRDGKLFEAVDVFVLPAQVVH